MRRTASSTRSVHGRPSGDGTWRFGDPGAAVGIPQATGHIDSRVLVWALGLALLLRVIPFALEVLALRHMTPDRVRHPDGPRARIRRTPGTGRAPAEPIGVAVRRTHTRGAGRGCGPMRRMPRPAERRTPRCALRAGSDRLTKALHSVPRVRYHLSDRYPPHPGTTTSVSTSREPGGNLRTRTEVQLA